MTTPRVLIVAGSDSGGGAGIQADIKTVTMLGGHAMTAITAITAQNTVGVQAVMQVPAEIVAAQIESVASDLGVDAVKIGMLGSAEIAVVLGEKLAQLADTPIVFDPVMVATSGDRLADAATIDAFEKLMAISALITPNLPELEALAGTPLQTEDEILDAALALHRRFGCAVLAKGGHGEGDRVTDLLIWQKGTVRQYSDRVDTQHTHGTGCSLASAIATGLGAGLPLDRSVDRAIQFVHSAILAAPGFGRGHGPIGHSLGTIPYHHLKAGESGGEWGVEVWDSVWGPTPTKH
jgi:hydroxymethylpyrimidine/phosphomethylpyrimidine kinase